MYLEPNYYLDRRAQKPMADILHISYQSSSCHWHTPACALVRPCRGLPLCLSFTHIVHFPCSFQHEPTTHLSKKGSTWWVCYTLSTPNIEFYGSVLSWATLRTWWWRYPFQCNHHHPAFGALDCLCPAYHLIAVIKVGSAPLLLQVMRVSRPWEMLNNPDWMLRMRLSIILGTVKMWSAALSWSLPETWFPCNVLGIDPPMKKRWGSRMGLREMLKVLKKSHVHSFSIPTSSGDSLFSSFQDHPYTCWNWISWDVIPTWNWTFWQGIVSDHCTVETCTNDIILTADW